MYTLEERFIFHISSGELAFVVLAEKGMIDDVKILENFELFLEWDEYFRADSRNVIVREFVDDGWVLFRNIHPIMDAAQNIRPSTDVTNTMWLPIGDPLGEWPKWVRPLGGHDAYIKGAQVTHNGARWINTHEGRNVWEPGVFGWEEVVDA